MITTLLAKFGLPIVLCIAAFAGGMITNQKLQKPATCPQAPACNCPPATEVHLADFDVEKLNNKRGTFNYNPSISNVRIVIESKDSAVFKQMIREALKN